MDLLEKEKIEKNFKRHPWELIRLKIMLFFLKIPTHENSILDIGSGDAFISKTLAKNFPQSQIVAVDANYTKEFFLSHKDKPDNLSFTNDFKNIPIKYTVNIVLLMDVIEHIENPNYFLKEIKQIKGITNFTTFFITVPAFQSLFSRHDKFLGHYRRYNKSDLNKLLLKEGFSITKSGYFFFSILPVRILQKLKDSRSISALHNYKANNIFTWLVKTALWCDFKISWYLSKIGINLPGLTCYCICKPIL